MNSPSNQSLFVLGCSHRVADLSARELISLPPDSIDEFYDGLGKLTDLDEYLLLNTCNRTEIYGASKQSFSINSVLQYLSRFQNIEQDFLKRHSYQRSDCDVVSHLFEVTSGIDFANGR